MIASWSAFRPAVRLAAVLCALLAASAAQAQNVRYVSILGKDANACTLAAPCRTLARGVAVTPNRGEVRLLNSGNFGAGVTIAKSLTVSGNGNTLILSGATAITVNSAAANVVLRGLLLTGLGTVPDGIVVIAAASMHIVGCEIERFSDDGIDIRAGAPETFVTSTISRNNGFGISVNGNGGTRMTLDDSRFENNVDRGASIAGAQSSVTRSTFAGNGGDGLNIFGGAASIAWSAAGSNGTNGFAFNDVEVQLESSLARGNADAGTFMGSGIIGSGIASISNMTVTDNRLGISNFATVRTRGNNRVFGNGDDFFGTAPAALGGT